MMAYSLKKLKIQELEDVKLSLVKQWLPVNILFILMLYTSFKTFEYLSVPLVTIFKNLTNVATAVGEWYFFRERVSLGIFVSLSIMTLVC